MFCTELYWFSIILGYWIICVHLEFQCSAILYRYKINFYMLFYLDLMSFILVLILGLELSFFIPPSVAPPREQKPDSQSSKAEGDKPGTDEVFRII